MGAFHSLAFPPSSKRPLAPCAARALHPHVANCLQNHCGDGLDYDCLASQPTESGHDGYCDQRADDLERVPDSEGEDAAEDRAALGRVGVVCESFPYFPFIKPRPVFTP